VKSLLHESDRSELFERFDRLRPDTVRRWGSMSPGGMLCHLTDSFRGVLGDRPIRDVSTLLGRTAMRWVALSTPIPWPRNVQTAREVDQNRDGTPPGEFEADRARLLELSEEFVRRLDPETMRHPIFGKLSAAEWGRWAYRHMDHHARQFGL
jgi:hypothetical protein